MFVQKNFSLKGILSFTGGHIVWMTVWISSVAALYAFTPLRSYLTIPWLPLSVVGTAVAFYVGFKNNQSYDRLWEARKIWGAIVNSSRAWGSIVRSYITNRSADIPISGAELASIHKTLIYRHIGWLYALRNQLLIPTPWEHVSQSFHIARVARRRQKQFGIGLVDDGLTPRYLKASLPTSEHDRLLNYANTATQIIDQQSQHLAELRTQGLIDDFRHMELQKVLNEFYVHQGKCERIKKFPLPRQYGGSSAVFVGIFIFLLPFGMASAFLDMLGDWGIWLSIPFTLLVCWVYLVMELVGDYSENPFEGMGNDIPMLSLCRVIEIDLKEMLGEQDIPAPVKAQNGVLM